MAQNKYPISIRVNGKVEQVRAMGDQLFCSKRQVFLIGYDRSGQLTVEPIKSLKHLLVQESVS